MTSTKKSLVVILIILILAGLGYFAHTKGLINLGFLQAREVEQPSVNTESGVKNENVEQSEIGFIHPLCFGEGFEINENINIEKCNKEFEKIETEKDEYGFIGSGYILFPEQEDSYRGSISYKIIKDLKDKIIVQTEDNMGGSSTVTSLFVFKKDGNSLNKKTEIHSGDRAHGGLGKAWTKFRDNGVDYWPHLTNMDLMEITYPGVSEKFNAGSDCNMCDFAVAHYYYNLVTQKSTLISVLIDSHFLDESPEEEEGCINSIYKSYIPEGKTQTEITPKQVDELNKKLMDTCIE